MSVHLICLTSALALSAAQASKEMNFNRIASFPMVRYMANGEAFISTDNGGVDDHSGETMFFSIGTVAKPTNQPRQRPSRDD